MTPGSWFSQQFNTLPALMPALLAASLAIAALGFVRVVYFVSVGYAFSICRDVHRRGRRAALAPGPAGGVQIVLLMTWGLRLGICIVGREARPAYRNQLEGNQS